MYSLKTLFFWSLILYIRVFRLFEYALLRLLRSPINNYITRKAASYGIIINDNYKDGAANGDVDSLNLIHLRVQNPNTFIRIINGGIIGLVESYMEQWWECDQLEEFATRLGELFDGVKAHPILRLQDWITLNADETPWEQSSSNSWATEMGMDFFGAMMGSQKLYMCGHWKNAETLEQAQMNNMELLGKKLRLDPGMRLLDLGCGYGALTRYLAEQFNIEAIGCTNSAEEAAKAKEFTTTNAKIIESDYTDVTGKFDRIVCVQMMEHLGGPRHYKKFFKKLNSLLAEDGLVLIQTTIVSTKPPLRCDQFGRKYLLQKSVAPHPLEILKAAEKQFLVEDVQNIGSHLEKTVMAYEANLERGWKETLSQKYDVKYYRMFHLYMKVYIAAVKARKVQMWQLVLSKKNSVLSYESTRL